MQDRKTYRTMGMFLLLCLALPVTALLAEDGVLRIIAFGAHPDDCELKAGGVAALWAEQGHKVKFVSCTNGDIGHFQMAGGALARRRTAEVEEADRILGIETEVLDNHDGELLPTLERRKEITRLIREWKADIVLTHRPNDYHPDHRYTSILVQDAAFMVTVPFFCPDIPYLTRNPVFMYFADGFQKPYPFTPDIAISVDSVMDKKLEALAVMDSQFLEAGVSGDESKIPGDEEEHAKGRERVKQSFDRRFERWTNQFRDLLGEIYGEEQAKNIKYAEAFELCEYGRRPSLDELKKMFPYQPR